MKAAGRDCSSEYPQVLGHVWHIEGAQQTPRVRSTWLPGPIGSASPLGPQPLGPHLYPPSPSRPQMQEVLPHSRAFAGPSARNPPPPRIQAAPSITSFRYLLKMTMGQHSQRGLPCTSVLKSSPILHYLYPVCLFACCLFLLPRKLPEGRSFVLFAAVTPRA